LSRSIDYDRVASILVEAAYNGEQDTADRWGITPRTIRNYQNRLEEDSKLSHIFNHKRRLFENQWATEIPGVIREGLNFLRRAAKEADPKDPAAIHAVAGFVKVLNEAELTREILDARLRGLSGAHGPEDPEMDTGFQALLVEG
jgi:hypothetical protein